MSQMVKIRDVHRLPQDIENDPNIKDQMASLGCLLVCTIDSLLAPVLVLAHTVNNLDLGDEQDHENEGDESNFKKGLKIKLPTLFTLSTLTLFNVSKRWTRG